MIYREFGKTGEKLSVLGFGGIRFPKELYMTEPGREELAELAVEAWKNGINYFDTAPSYCNQKGELIYGMAFRHMKDFYVSTKSQISEDPTADDVRRRLETSLRRMGLEKIHFYHMWCILDIDQYRRVIAPGGPYWGALKAKEEGLIDGIGMQSHVSITDVLDLTLIPTVRKFCQAGYEVQITEFDLGIGQEATEENLEKQARKLKSLMLGLQKLVNNGLNFTSMTFWGYTDRPASGGWRAGEHALLFDEEGNPKRAFYGVLQDESVLAIDF